MPVRRLDNLLPIAAIAILIFSTRRFLLADPTQTPVRPSREALPQPGDAVQRGSRPQGGCAGNPLRIPWAGWKDILWRSHQGINDDRLLATAGGVVYFGLLAIFPAITALVSCYGLFANPSTIATNLQTLAMMLPEGSFQIIQDQVGRVVAKGNTELGATFLFSLLLAIWSANAGVKSIIDALNVAYEEREKRSFIRLNLVSLGFTSGGLLALLLMLAAVVAFPLAFDHLGLGPASRIVAVLARWPLLLLVLIAALAVLYRFGPSREAPRWQWLSVGAAVAALLWIAGSALLSLYLSHFADYSATYGALGAAIGLMMWMWMSAIVVLLGAELNAEIERWTARDITSRRPEPLGTRGAFPVDTAAPPVPAG
jgi:membrane protein